MMNFREGGGGGREMRGFGGRVIEERGRKEYVYICVGARARERDGEGERQRNSNVQVQYFVWACRDTQISKPHICMD